MERLFKLGIEDVVGFLEKSTAINPNSSGRVNMDSFLIILGIPRTTFLSRWHPALHAKGNVKRQATCQRSIAHAFFMHSYFKGAPM